MSNLPPRKIHHYPHPGATRTAYVVWNPKAGSGLGKKRVELKALRQRFWDNGWNVAVLPTRAAGDGTAAALEAVELGADVVVAAGGDGTINEVVQGLAGSDVPLGILPVGTINVLAQELNIPLDDPLAAVDALTTGETVVIDLGRANGRYFTMMVGLGFDAELTSTILPSLKQWTGPVAYWVAGFQSFVKHKAVRTRLTYSDGHRTKRLRALVYMAVVSNTGMYAGNFFKITPEASLSDGLLDICLFRSKRWYTAIYQFGLTMIGRLRSDPGVDFFHAKHLTIQTSRPFPYQLDGDSAGTTPLTVEVVPKALKVMGGRFK